MGLGDLRATLVAAAAVLVVAVWPLGMAATSERIETSRIGDLLLPFDPEIWRIDGRGDSLVIAQVDDRHGDLGIGVSIKSGTEEECSGAAVLAHAGVVDLHGSDAEAFTLARPGFDLHVATVSLGCRNWTGSPIFACTFYRDRVYSFIANPGGCNTPPNYHEPVIELLSGLKAQ